jgi:hypothetical protein
MTMFKLESQLGMCGYAGYPVCCVRAHTHEGPHRDDDGRWFERIEADKDVEHAPEKKVRWVHP